MNLEKIATPHYLLIVPPLFGQNCGLNGTNRLTFYAQWFGHIQQIAALVGFVGYPDFPT
jgi:hypothetical protein